MKHGRKDYNERLQDSCSIIPDDEPVFLLRAQDMFAAGCVELWAQLAENAGVDADTVAAVRAHAQAMRNWPVKKLPDTPDFQITQVNEEGASG